MCLTPCSRRASEDCIDCCNERRAHTHTLMYRHQNANSATQREQSRIQKTLPTRIRPNHVLRLAGLLRTSPRCPVTAAIAAARFFGAVATIVDVGELGQMPPPPIPPPISAVQPGRLSCFALAISRGRVRSRSSGDQRCSGRSRGPLRGRRRV